MNAFVRNVAWVATGVVFAFTGASSAHESQPRPEARPVQAAEPTCRARQGGGGVAPSDDPLLRALVMGIAANILREAAAQPDPVEALGNEVERRVAQALADPNTMRLVESGLRQAFQDAPEALREPLALFAMSVLRSMRREALQESVPQRRYY